MHSKIDKIIVLPDGGLCNRMRVLDSAIALSRRTDLPVSSYWVNNSDLNCGFDKLFYPIDNLEVINKKQIPYLFRTAKKANLFLPKIYRHLAKKLIFFDPKLSTNQELVDLINTKSKNRNIDIKAQSIYVRSCQRFYPNPKSFDEFRPIHELEQQIKESIKDFNENTIGVHIRRGDNRWSIENSPLEAFKKRMNEEVQKNPSTNFFLATDDTNTKLTLQRIYKDRIIVTSEEATRQSEKGIQQALVELYSLSKTKKIMGSYWSSFSETASYIGRIELEVVTKSNN